MGGGGGGSNKTSDWLNKRRGEDDDDDDKPSGPADLPATREGLAQNMMERGRMGFDFSKMGAAMPLAGAQAQPMFSTPPPQFNKEFWLNWDKGDSVDGANYKGAVSSGDWDKYNQDDDDDDRGGKEKWGRKGGSGRSNYDQD